MKANELNLNRFLAQTDTQFIIPVYQRNYDWTLAQCKQLLDDIVSVGKDTNKVSHFIGSIVYMHDNVYSASSVRELSIIDGQQRLTTLTLVYVAIYALAKESGNTALVNRIQETYLINKFAQEEEKLKLKPTENNDKAFRFLLRNDPNEEYQEYSRLIENYNYFKGKVAAMDLEIIQNGLNKLLFVEISLERDKDNAQKIFESLNSTGLELSQSDLIRNYILMGLNHRDQINIYNNYWKYIELNATHYESNGNRVSDFIRDFLTLKNRDIPNKSKVYNEFKSKYPLTDVHNWEVTLSEIKRFSNHYNKFINPEREEDQELNYQLNLINKLEINVAYPFMLEVYDDFTSGKINKETIVQVFELIQSFTWRRFIVGLPTNALNKIFMRLYEDILQNEYVTSIQKSLLRKKSTQRFPLDAEVISNLKEKDMYSVHTKNRNYFLERLENYQNREPVRIEDNSDITVEHIFPQTPDSQWKTILGEAEYLEMKEKYLNTAANLTLSGNNGKLGNKYFTEKRDMNIEGGEQGYKFSRLWLNRHLAQLDKWNLSKMEERFNLIAERFLQIWPYPSVQFNDVLEYEEVNIFDAEDPTHKRLEYAILFDQKLDVKTITELYNHVMKALFELNPQVFFTDSIIAKLTLTKHRGDCREAIQLNDTYYIEQHMSSKAKLDRLKLILTTLDFADELFIKYSKELIPLAALTQ